MKKIYLLYGTSCRISKTTLLFVFSLLSFLLSTVSSRAQVNAYAKVTNINGSKTVVTVSSLNERFYRLAIGDEVLIMQMQDANVIGNNTTNNANFGTLSTIGSAGLYEIAVISAINTGRTQITLRSALDKSFNLTGSSQVQLVSFTKLSTGNYTTTAAISAVVWNKATGTGGVVAFQVPGTLTLRHSVSADEAGFAGGSTSSDAAGDCAPNTYTSNNANYGMKGDGIYNATSTNYTRGRGRLVNGGGGGNYDNAGGGGGSNYSAGGNGGAGFNCANDPSGGLGGAALGTYLMTGSRLFMGGGGGGGQGNDGNQSAGAPGGGIVIIKARALTTSCTNTTLSITANGGAATRTASDGNDGAGGAGAAGTILMEIGAFNVPNNCRLQIQANGGKGGDVNHADAHGGGGGGGQGAILFSGSTAATNVTTATTPGAGGKNSSGNNASSAAGGGGTANAGVISGIGTVLTIQLLDFTATSNRNQALLRWTAAGEANPLFTIYHSTDGISFTPVGTVNGNNNERSANYSFSHTGATPGKNYYQLQVTSTQSNRAIFSAITSVTIDAMQSALAAWPNPAHGHFNITIPGAYNSKPLVVTITDLAGKLMYTNSYKAANGIITVTPARQLKAGLYLFTLQQDGYEQTGKLIIQ